ncbi:adenylate/guanylate cyclase domain-containing protein [Methylobacterium planeticum]|uniref:Adenylate/guanylate cyclase domain-containing protein n=1 Tax=Methylobacterium planeticum TaxID=2615211 RepID=A0A6N6MQE0_9HYPH|nr:adenylate/guanylate cyclase domain-containing protein [Methylobacterium planeticum]KAB1072284.1 adenylate/guanylate cyclase domain-containing protein [Methylobacterium planeticum]
MADRHDVARIEREMMARATASDDADAIVSAFCEALVAAGLPLWRAALSLPILDPLFRGVNLIWTRGRGVCLAATEHGPEGAALVARSPMTALLGQGRRFGRWRLSDGEGTGMPLLAELRAEGGSDYVMHLAAFAPSTAITGVAISFASDHPEGFSADDLDTLAALVPVTALATAKLCLARTMREALGTYLGSRTGAQVLAGRIRRGEGEVVSAAILLADLRGFTALTDRDDPLRVVSWLDEHFDALGEPVARHGGEVLKFLGDGFLAIFPVDDPDADPCRACAGALSAARDGLARNDALNAARRAAGLPALPADVVLHYGPVVYGNVGTGRRLDFTVVGRAVNEASRIERLCEERGEPVLVSDAFARRCAARLRPAGAFSLRGVGQVQKVWAP